jgi:hypothetical protein
MPSFSGVWNLVSQYQAKASLLWPQGPGAPTSVSATAGDASATVSFTAPTFTGVPPGITGYLATSNPGGLTATGASSPLTVTGLSNGTAYTFGVQATNGVQFGPAGTSGSVTPSAPTAFWGGGNTTGGFTNVISSVVISSLGNATDFGDLSYTRQLQYSCASSSRGIFAGGNTPTINNISFITFSTSGNASSFGSLSTARYGGAGLSNSTRGIFAAGSGPIGNIDFITIASTGNSTNFGNATPVGENTGAFASPTRGVWAGGSGPVNVIEYVTIATTGNSLDFGDLTVALTDSGGASNSTRGLVGGSYSAGVYNTINYVTIASTGNAIDFGDLNVVGYGNRGAASSTRALFAGGLNAGGGFAYNNAIEYVTINTTGNSSDFGDLTVSVYDLSACSNAHGGL